MYPATQILGMEPQAFETAQEAKHYVEIAYALLQTKYGNVEREKKPRKLRYWCLTAKAESDCRHCQEPATHLHHVVPRSLYPKGAENVDENGVPLCSSCHRRWHSRVIEIPHGVLKQAEFRFACRSVGVGWVERHYFDPEWDARERWSSRKPEVPHAG